MTRLDKNDIGGKAESNQKSRSSQVREKDNGEWSYMAKD